MKSFGPYRRVRPRRVMAVFAVLCMMSVAIGAVSGLPALAQVVDPSTTTVPPDSTTTTAPPDTTTTTLPPDTTTTLPPETTTTTAPPPAPGTTTAPAPDTTTAPPPTTAGIPTELLDLLAQVGKLNPGEERAPEFPALSDHQRALVQDLQTATDAYALRRFALIDLSHKVTAAKNALKDAKAAENAAISREVLGLADAAVARNDKSASTVSLLDDSVSVTPALVATGEQSHGGARDDRLTALRVLKHRLDADLKKARAIRVQTEAAVAALSPGFAEQTKGVTDAADARAAAASAVEDELGPNAVHAQADGITATLVSVQAGQPDALVIDGMSSPIPGAALGSPFGLRNDPLSNGAGFHPGIDLEAGFGTPIHAAAAGVVVIAGDCGGYGNCVVIDHGASMATLYGHQSELHVAAGQHVDAGEVIGLVGSTGASTGPHLHFEVRIHGIPIDPLLALLPA